MAGRGLNADVGERCRGRAWAHYKCDCGPPRAGNGADDLGRLNPDPSPTGLDPASRSRHHFLGRTSKACASAC